MRMCTQQVYLVLEKVLVRVFYKIFVWVLLSLNTRCGRGRACFVVVGKIGAFISDRFQWILSDISSLPRRNDGSCLYIPYLGY